MYHFTLVAKKKEPLDIRNFDYSARSWTGKSPKQFLIDWCRKNFPKSPNPAFEKVPVGRYWKCRYVFPMIFFNFPFGSFKYRNAGYLCFVRLLWI